MDDGKLSKLEFILMAGSLLMQAALLFSFARGHSRQAFSTAAASALFAAVFAFSAAAFAVHICRYVRDRRQRAQSRTILDYVRNDIPLRTSKEEILEDIDDILEQVFRGGEGELIKDAIYSKMEIIMLQGQINPHFLYNTLETIRGQALVRGQDDIAEMVENLARLFRYNISAKEEIVTLSDELENLRNYICIQNYRFRGKISFQVESGDVLQTYRDYKLPILTLQPIVENAVTHGLEPKIGPGTLRLRAFCTQYELILQIIDDGIGIAEEDLKSINERLSGGGKAASAGAAPRKETSNGIALTNVDQRLKAYFGRACGLRIISSSAGTTVELNLPLLEEGGKR